MIVWVKIAVLLLASVAVQVRVNKPLWQVSGPGVSLNVWNKTGVQLSTTGIITAGGTSTIELNSRVSKTPVKSNVGGELSTKFINYSNVFECPASSFTNQKMWATSPTVKVKSYGNPDATGSNIDMVMVAPMVEDTAGSGTFPCSNELQVGPTASIAGPL